MVDGTPVGDCNNLPITYGISCYYGYFTANTATANYAFVIQFAENANIRLQFMTYFPTSTSEDVGLYMRKCISGSWSAWKQV